MGMEGRRRIIASASGDPTLVLSHSWDWEMKEFLSVLVVEPAIDQGPLSLSTPCVPLLSLSSRTPLSLSPFLFGFDGAHVSVLCIRLLFFSFTHLLALLVIFPHTHVVLFSTFHHFPCFWSSQVLSSLLSFLFPLALCRVLPSCPHGNPCFCSLFNPLFPLLDCLCF